MQPQQLESVESATATIAVLEEGAGSGRRGRIWAGILRIFTTNRKMTIGICIVGFFVLVALLGPLVVHEPANPFSNTIFEPPSSQHWFGTTAAGEDVFIQVFLGTGRTLLVGFTVAILSTALSVIIGLTAGYFGGLVDDVLSLITNVFLILPGVPLAIVIASLLPFKGVWPMILVLWVTTWAWGARVLRSQTLSLRRREFVTAARSVGERPLRIVFLEILPNEIAIVASSFVSTMIYALLADLTLEFLGLGNTSELSWGMVLYWAYVRQAFIAGAWWWFIPPGLGMAILGAGLVLINYGIDELANPRLRTSSKSFKRARARKAVA